MNTDTSDRSILLSLSRRACFVLSIALLSNSILRGIRAPGRWAYTELLFNYDFGFSKRALQGAVLSFIGVPSLYGYKFCFWYDLTILLVNVVLLAALLKKICEVGNESFRSAALVFSSSLAIVMLAHTIGYGDQIALLVTLVALRIESFAVRSVFAALLFPVCLLIHETEFVLFFPVILFRFMSDLNGDRTCFRLISLSVVIASALLMFGFLSHTQLSTTSAAAMYRSIQAKADYQLRQDELFMLTSTFSNNFAVQLKAWRDPDFLRFFLYSFIVTFPTTSYLLRETLVALRGRPHGKFLRLPAVVASLAPLSMYAIGLDANRWTTLATMASFLVFSVVIPNTEGEIIPVRPTVLPALLVAMNLGSSIYLFDGYVVQAFPYEEHLDDLGKVIFGSAPFPPRPEQCVESGCDTSFTFVHPVSGAANGTKDTN
jgi:hypothetical protein